MHYMALGHAIHVPSINEKDLGQKKAYELLGRTMNLYDQYCILPKKSSGVILRKSIHFTVLEGVNIGLLPKSWIVILRKSIHFIVLKDVVGPTS